MLVNTFVLFTGGTHPHRTVDQAMWVYVAAVVLLIEARSPRFVKRQRTWGEQAMAVAAGWYPEPAPPLVWWSARTFRPGRPLTEFLRCLGMGLMLWVLYLGMSNSWNFHSDQQLPRQLLSFGVLVLLYGVRCGAYLAALSGWGKPGWFAVAVTEELLLHRLHESVERQKAEQQVKAAMAPRTTLRLDGSYSLDFTGQAQGPRMPL